MADYIPGINVGNAINQLKSYVGLAPTGDYDIFDNLTVSNRPGQTNLINTSMPGGVVTTPPIPTVQTGSSIYGFGDTGGSTSGGGTVQADPYAQYGGTAVYNSLLNDFNNGISNVFNSSGDSARNMLGSGGIANRQSILDWTRRQQGIDREAVQNESSKIQGGRDILGMVGRGIKSGGVMLANKNAGNSSAAQAIANAYGTLGRQQMSTIGNQYAQNADDIALEQSNMGQDMALAKDKYKQDIMDKANAITANAEAQLAAIDTKMMSASLPNRVAMAQEKERIKANALSILSPLEAQLVGGLDSIKATGIDDNRAKANTQLGAGQADPNLFNYTTQAPMGFAGQNPAGGNLPIFTYNGKKKTA